MVKQNDNKEKPRKTQSIQEGLVEIAIEQFARLFLQQALWKQKKKEGRDDGVDLLP